MAEFHWEPRVCFSPILASHLCRYLERVQSLDDIRYRDQSGGTSLCLLTPQVSTNSERRRRSWAAVIKESWQENVTDVEACANEKSESKTVRHVDSGVVMDGE